MSYKIILDSCGEIPEEYKGNTHFERVPLSLEVGDYFVYDDDTFNQAEFLAKVAACPTCPRSACPSPERYMEAFHADVDHVYAVTLTSKLSGSYNSACLGKGLYVEKYGHKDIHVVDSLSASGGETQIALKIMELEEQGLPFETIVEQIEAFRDSVRTYFVLDNLETLRKNGRLSTMKAMIASTLNIKPVMDAQDGVIIQRGQCVGLKKALGKLCELLLNETQDKEARRLIISHCNAPERAELVRRICTEQAHFKEVLVMDMRGISSMYANDGGIIVTT